MGMTGTTVTATAESYDHFTCSSRETGEILADGGLTLRVYYTRNTYTITVENDDAAGSVTGAGTYLYKAAVVLTATANEGYRFVGWFLGDNLQNDATMYEFTANCDVTYRAAWEENETPDCGAVGTEGLSYKEYGDGYEVEKYTGTATEVVIPTEYNGKPVLAIAADAFRDCTHVESVVIPDTVLTIMQSAFNGCSGLQSVKMSANLTSIGGMAFAVCTSLEEIVIPLKVETVAYYAFFGCENLKIYCQATEAGDGWSGSWNTSGCEVVWGYREEN